MENKINIAELLKDCPKGMELDCTVFGTKVIYQKIYKTVPYPIVVQTEQGFEFRLTQYGQIHNIVGAECVIFPKGKTTWEGFQRPFKNGDIITDSLSTCIFKGECKIKGTVDYYCGISSGHFSVKDNKCSPDIHYGCIVYYRFATEEEKEKLFKAIKDNGYKWNPETKTLEKLIEPKFKVGDRIVKKNSVCVPILITNVSDEFYYSNTESSVGILSISEQDEYTLLPNKFDITTLVPFESKVLVRDCNSTEWDGEIFVRYANKSFNNCNFVTLGGCRWKQCIPYEGNEHLLGTTNDCNDYYKNWE